MSTTFPGRIRSAAVLAVIVASVLAHLTGGLSADATGLFTFSFNIGFLDRGAALGQFQYPTGLAIGPQNQIYVADSQNDRVQVFTANGGYLATFGTTGDQNGQFSYPSGIAVDVAGTILVADNFNHRIQVFDANYNYRTTFGSFGNYDVLDPVNLDPLTGNYIGPTPTLSGLNYPTRVALLPGTRIALPGSNVTGSGLVVITDSQNYRVIVLDSSLTPLFAFGQSGDNGNGPSDFDYPVGIGLDATHIYVADPGNNRIQIFAYDAARHTATIETTFGSVGTENGIGDLDMPYDVQPDGQGHLMIVDRGNSRALFLTPDPSASLTPRCSEVTASAAAGRCAIVSTDASHAIYDALVIGGFTETGTENGKFTHPQAVATDATGRLIVLDTEGSRVVVFKSAHLTVQPVTLDQTGSVQSGQNVTMTVTILNDGAAPLTVQPVVFPSLAGQLTIPPAQSMDPGQTVSFPVTFRTAVTGALSFAISASGQPAVGHALTSAAVSAGPITVLPAPGEKMSLSFATPPSPVGVETVVAVKLIVTNTGTTTLQTVTPQVLPTPVNLFSSIPTIAASSTGPLLSQASRTFTFTYTALAVGTATFTGGATATYATGSIAIAPGAGPTTSITVTPDAVAPSTSIVNVSPAAGTSACAASGNNWYLSRPVTVVLQATDNKAVRSIHYSVTGLVPFSGDSDGPTATVTLSYDGVPKLTYHAIDTAGNVEADHEIVYCIDSVAPTIAKGGVDPAPNAAKWNNTNTTVKFISKDDTSGQAFVTPPTTVSTQGAGQVVHGLARDGAGNTAQADVFVNIDKTAPVVECHAVDPVTLEPITHSGLNGWFKKGTASVTVKCTATDQTGLSGIASVRAYCPDTTGSTTTTLTQPGTATYKTGPLSAFATCLIHSEGFSSVHGDATDVAGNIGVSKPGQIKIDRTPPVVGCSTVSVGEIWPPNHKMVPWNTSVVVTDLLSGSGGFKLTAYSSSEALNWLGDGNTFKADEDMTGWTKNVLVTGPTAGVTSGYVRSERSGLGTGRIYRLLYSVQDAAGNEATCTAVLTDVPHDQGK